MAALIRDFDWASTSIGAIDAWPQSLKTTTGLLLESPVPIVLLWGEDGIMIYNDAYSKFAGRRHPRLLGSKVREGWPEVADFNDNVMKVVLAGGTLEYHRHVLTLERHGRPEDAWMNLYYSPVIDESGAPGGVIAIVVEITATVRAEEQLRESEDRLRALMNATSDVMYSMSADWSEMDEIDGRGFIADSVGPNRNWMDVNVPADTQAEVKAAIADAVARKGVFQLEHRVLRADRSIGWAFSRAIPILDGSGEIVRWFGAATDVTERKRTEEHLRLVVNELNHRVKNNLAMTQAIAMQTFRTVDDLSQAQDRFAARMVALGQATDLLTGERWAGASLQGVIEQAVRPHCNDAARCVIEGPEVQLTPKTALALTLALHELTTNALKYGAWSVAGGSVTIRWSIAEQDDGRRLHLTWCEQGGPPVIPPGKRGFGSRLIERGLAGEMGGKVEMRFEPTGLSCVVDAPLNPQDSD